MLIRDLKHKIGRTHRIHPAVGVGERDDRVRAAGQRCSRGDSRGMPGT